MQVVGTVVVIDYDAAIETYKYGITLAVYADNWDLQDQNNAKLAEAKAAKAAHMKEKAIAMTAADPPDFTGAAAMFAEAATFDTTDAEFGPLRCGALKELGNAQQADGGEEDPVDLRAAVTFFAEAAAADPADEEVVWLHVAALKEIGMGLQAGGEEVPPDFGAALGCFVEALALAPEDEELLNLKGECEAALAPEGEAEE